MNKPTPPPAILVREGAGAWTRGLAITLAMVMAPILGAMAYSIGFRDFLIGFTSIVGGLGWIAFSIYVGIRVDDRNRRRGKVPSVGVGQP
jgi:hypothetical protein